MWMVVRAMVARSPTQKAVQVNIARRLWDTFNTITSHTTICPDSERQIETVLNSTMDSRGAGNLKVASAPVMDRHDLWTPLRRLVGLSEPSAS
eukprot:m.483137 g.483137  ORF g.483137 m.483137 type:complete len:93 (-) comp63437_c0_seq1:147-425(-)